MDQINLVLEAYEPVANLISTKQFKKKACLQ